MRTWAEGAEVGGGKGLAGKPRFPFLLHNSETDSRRNNTQSYLHYFPRSLFRQGFQYSLHSLSGTFLRKTLEYCQRGKV